MRSSSRSSRTQHKLPSTRTHPLHPNKHRKRLRSIQHEPNTPPICHRKVKTVHVPHRRVRERHPATLQPDPVPQLVSRETQLLQRRAHPLHLAAKLPSLTCRRRPHPPYAVVIQPYPHRRRSPGMHADRSTSRCSRRNRPRRPSLKTVRGSSRSSNRRRTRTYRRNHGWRPRPRRRPLSHHAPRRHEPHAEQAPPMLPPRSHHRHNPRFEHRIVDLSAAAVKTRRASSPPSTPPSAPRNRCCSSLHFLRATV